MRRGEVKCERTRETVHGYKGKRKTSIPLFRKMIETLHLTRFNN